MKRQFSDKGLALTAVSEGLRLEAYLCPAMVWTIGYGHTRGVKKGDKITKEKALDFLREDVQDSVSAVNRLVKVPLSQGQFDALVDFVFNLGEGALAKSTLLKLLNMGKYEDARKEFAKWNKADGRVLDGLTKRRKAEADMFV